MLCYYVVIMEHERTSINVALAEIQIARARLSATGAVDVEGGQLDALERQVTHGEISPAEVIDKVQRLLSGRQDYH